MKRVGWIITTYDALTTALGKPNEPRGWTTDGFGIEAADEDKTLKLSRTWKVLGETREATAIIGNLINRSERIIF